MSFYIYKLVESLILSNTSTNLLVISHQLSAITYHSSPIPISYQPSVSLSVIHYFYRT